MIHRREGHGGSPSWNPLCWETNGEQARMVFVRDAVPRSKDSAQRRDLKFESGALLSSDRSLCEPDPAWEVNNKKTTQFPQRTAHPKGEGTPGSNRHFPWVGSAFFPWNLEAFSTIKLTCPRGCPALPLWHPVVLLVTRRGEWWDEVSFFGFYLPHVFTSWLLRCNQGKQ